MSEMKLKLPKGWRWVRLGDVTEINPRRPSDLARSDTEPTTFVPMEAVDDASGRITAPVVKPFCDVRRGYTYFAERDVLFAKITPCMQNGKHAIAQNLIDGIGFGTTEFHVVRPSNIILSEWIHLFLRQPSILGAAELSFTGSAGQQRVPKEFISYLDIPLPPLDEQRRIVALLDHKLSAVARARAAAQAQLDAAQALPAAYLRGVFESDEAKGWPLKRLGEITTVVRGSSPRPKGDPRLYGGPVPRLMVEDVTRDGMYVVPNVDSLTEEGAQYSRPMKKGDLVIVVSGNPGLPAILAVDACIHDGFAGFRDIDPNEFTASFLYYFLLYSKTRTDSLASGAIFRNLTTDQLKSLEIRQPNIERQQLISDSLGQHQIDVSNLLRVLESQLATIDALPAALLRQAFNGEL